MTDFRITFSKSGPLVFISHLDLAHTFVRAFNRAGIPLKYSSGFNPHPKLVFALPLSVGMAGENELCDVGLNKDMDIEEFERRIKSAMPEHIEIKAVKESPGKFKNIFSAEYRYVFEGKTGIGDAVREVLSRDDITVTKKTKSGEKDINIRKQIFSYDVSEENGNTVIDLCTDASSEGYLNPEYIMKVLEAEGIVISSDAQSTRTRINLK
jgi:radical SAM-linked protein